MTKRELIPGQSVPVHIYDAMVLCPGCGQVLQTEAGGNHLICAVEGCECYRFMFEKPGIVQLRTINYGELPKGMKPFTKYKLVEAQIPAGAKRIA